MVDIITVVIGNDNGGIEILQSPGIASSFFPHVFMRVLVNYESLMINPGNENPGI